MELMGFFTRMAKEIWWAIEPTDGKSWVSLMVMVAMVIASFIMKTPRIGATRNFFKLAWQLALLWILWKISPIFAGIVALLAVLNGICSHYKLPFKRVLLGAAAVFALGLAFYNAFVV